LADRSFLSETSAIARYLGDSFDDCKIMGTTAHERGLDKMRNNRVWGHILYPIVTAFHVLHQGLGSKLERTHDPARGEHSRTVALAHAALVDRHLSDGRPWLLGGDQPTFSDITLATAIGFSKSPVNVTPLDERCEHLDALGRRWQTFLAAYADRQSDVPELEGRV
jgi:glutathione S-transferase